MRVIAILKRARDAVEARLFLYGKTAASRLLELGGGAAVTYGVLLISRPAGFIAGGVLAIGYAYLLSESGGHES